MQQAFSCLGMYIMVLLKIHACLIEKPFQVKVNYPCCIGPEQDIPNSFVKGKEKIWPKYKIDPFSDEEDEIYHNP